MIPAGKDGTQPSASTSPPASVTCEKANHLFPVDSELRERLHSNGRDFFAEEGYYSLNVDFSLVEKEQLDGFMKRRTRRKDSVIRYLTGHTGYLISKRQMDSLLPPSLRCTVITHDVLQSLQFYFGDPASPTLFALEVHEVKLEAGAPEQTAHADITFDDAMNRDLSRLAVIFTISTSGPVTTMVYPRTRAILEAEDQLARMPCIRATEFKNCLLLDAALAHKGSAT